LDGPIAVPTFNLVQHEDLEWIES
jgi:hypothetical protein